MTFAELLDSVREILGREHRAEERMRGVADLLADRVEGFDCIAFFVVDPEHRRQLLKGPEAGAGLSPETILVGQGLCGQVAERGITIAVDDVTQELNYLSGHDKTLSEIVLPIYRNGVVKAELDVNSFQRARFGPEERLFLEEICLLMTDQI